MLDKWFKFISGRLDAHTTDVIAQRAHIERERAGDEARQHAGREFQNAEGFTTPLPKAFENAQNAYARARREFEANGGATAFNLLVAMLVARDKRDDARDALRKYEAAEASRQDTGIHPEVRPHYANAFRHGVEPRHLANVRAATSAITFDLIRWDGHDPDMQDPDNPMRQVFEIYASRLIVVPERFGDTKRSVSGTPVHPERDTDTVYYMFNEIAGEKTEAPEAGIDEAAVAELVEAQLTINVVEDGVDTGRSAPIAEATEADPPHHSDDGIDVAPVPVAEVSREAGPYKLPPRFDEAATAKLRAGAIQFMQMDGEWDYELKAAAGFFDPRRTTQEIIDRVTLTPDDPRSTPFRYFTQAASRGGLEAGNRAYREATIRRFMLEIATAPSFAAARANLGLA